jgi:hypothetical protein
MKNLVHVEEAAMFGLSIFLFYYQLDYAWWLFWVLLLLPDIGMLGYLINTKVGAITYNFLHHKAVSIILYCSGFCFQNSALMLSGLILFGHSSMDRIFGYGLKYQDAFKHTHLGWMK